VFRVPGYFLKESDGLAFLVRSAPFRANSLALLPAIAFAEQRERQLGKAPFVAAVFVGQYVVCELHLCNLQNINQKAREAVSGAQDLGYKKGYKEGYKKGYLPEAPLRNTSPKLCIISNLAYVDNLRPLRL
jgi:hypothetical protein